MSYLTHLMDAKLYPHYESNWDDKFFRQIILSYLHENTTLLDLGAGAGIVSEMNFKNKAKHICGIDPDERVLNNPFLDDSKIGTGEDIPYADSTFDMVIADNVLEHLENPAAVFSQVNRVLKPNGLFIAKTPNKFHYVPTIAKLTPHKFHQIINRMRGRQFEDTFPTLYKINSIKDVKKIAHQTDFILKDYKLLEGRPEYLRMIFLTYCFGWLYERFVNLHPSLQSLRAVMVVVLKKS